MVFNLPTSTECVKCDFYHLVQNTHKELFFLNTSPHIIPVLFHMRIILKVFVVSDCLVHLLKDLFFLSFGCNNVLRSMVCHVMLLNK